MFDLNHLFRVFTFYLKRYQMKTRNRTKTILGIAILAITALVLTTASADAAAVEAIYNPATGDLSFDVGEGIAVIGIQAAGMIPGNVDENGLGGELPVQNDGASLAFFNETGLPVGVDSVGRVMPTWLTVADMGFSYTPIGSPTVIADVTVPSTEGDLDGDGDVDDADLNLMLSSFDSPPSLLDEISLDVLLTNFGRTDMAAANPVPEPQAALLLTIGMIGIAMRFRRKEK